MRGCGIVQYLIGFLCGIFITLAWHLWDRSRMRLEFHRQEAEWIREIERMRIRYHSATDGLASATDIIE
jgi:hypothetical protein